MLSIRYPYVSLSGYKVSKNIARRSARREAVQHVRRPHESPRGESKGCDNHRETGEAEGEDETVAVVARLRVEGAPAGIL